ncbi:hypothetical protein BGZ89_010860, partial [Linnemannia elongata]
MNNPPLDQLDANVPDKGSPNTTQAPPRKRYKSRKFLGVPKSLDSRDPSQQSTQSFGVSQFDGNMDNPLPIAQTEDLLRSVIFPENVAKPAVKAALPGLQERIVRTDQLLYCNMLLRQDSAISSSSEEGEEKATDDPANALQALTFDSREQKWLKKVKEDPGAQNLMQWTVTKMVEAYIADTTKDSIKIAEIVALGPVL